MLRHKEVHDRAKRVFGKDHSEYILMKRRFLLVNANCGPPLKGTLVAKDPKLNGREVIILRATEDGKKYIVEIFGSAEETGSAQIFKVTPSQLILAADTPCLYDGDDEAFTVFVDSFYKKTKSYKVFAMCGVEDDENYAYFDVSGDSLSVQFVPPEKFGNDAEAETRAEEAAESLLAELIVDSSADTNKRGKKGKRKGKKKGRK